MGYKTLEIAVNPDSAMNMKIFLPPSAKTLKEVYVKRRKEKYSRKNNPAVELMENIRAASKRHNPQDSAWYSYDKYEKMTIGLSDFEIPDSGSWSDRKIPFIRDPLVPQRGHQRERDRYGNQDCRNRQIFQSKQHSECP